MNRIEPHVANTREQTSSQIELGKKTRVRPLATANILRMELGRRHTRNDCDTLSYDGRWTKQLIFTSKG